MQYDVFGLGNALVDIQARISDNWLQQTGFDKGIMTLVDDAQQRAVLDRLAGVSLHRCASGSAANTIVAVADFGGKAAFAGRVADDELGQFFVADMRRLGVRMDVPLATGGQTGTSAILITEDAQRTMLTNLGISATFCSDDLAADELRRAKYVYVEGYLLLNPVQKAAVYRAIETAKNAGCKVAFTASDPFLCDLLKDEIWSLVRGPVDLFFCNELEAQALTGKTDSVECAAELHRSCENVAMTLGPNGSLLMHEGRPIPIEGVPTAAIDTTGAGDMYAGALLFGITNGLSWKQAGHLASHAAARVVSQLGARLQNRFTPAEISELLQ